MATDYIVAGLLIYFFCRGWIRGLLRTVLGPVSLVIGCILGYMYYQNTRNIGISLLICAASPFVITLIAALLFKIWHKAVKDPHPLSLPSNLLGGAVSVLWGGSYVLIILLLIAVVPLHFEWFDKAQKDVTESKSYAMIRSWTGNKVPATKIDIDKVKNIFDNPETLEQFESTPEFQSLAEDDKLKQLFSDEEVAVMIESKNYNQLLANPKVQALLQDEELMKKMFALNMRIMEGEPVNAPIQQPAKTGPKIIEIE